MDLGNNMFNIICVIVLFIMMFSMLWMLNIHLEDQKQIAIIFEKHTLKTNETLESINETLEILRDQLKKNKDHPTLIEEISMIRFMLEKKYEKTYMDELK